jgi:uncharacterized protein (TIGR03382 family)
VQLVGSAGTCDAACVAQPITECVSGDGCCADGCDESNDSDCAGNNVTGGCDAGAGHSFALALFALLLLKRRR